MAIEVIDLFINESTEARESLTKVVKFSGYQKINKVWIDVFLTAPKGFVNDWALETISVNGIRIPSSNTHEFSMKVSDRTGLQTGSPTTLKIGENNQFSIQWRAPFGAGVISPHASITAKLRVDGEKLLPIDSELLENVNPVNIVSNLERIQDKATIPTIIFVIALLALFILFIFLAPRILLTLGVINTIKEVK